MQYNRNSIEEIKKRMPSSPPPNKLPLRTIVKFIFIVAVLVYVFLI